MKTHRSKATAIPCPHPGPRHTAWLVSAILCWVAAPPVHAQISELSYAITNGTIIITAHPGTNENVTIPSTVNGLPVVAI